ncbi:MAG TPA: glutathione S-transferase family protein [Kofleriaceae bacterium]|nr:glutathione S-transferase family protein [Kofleriaceae bacterium]
MGLRLYHAPRSRSGTALWMLEELGVPYEITLVEIRRGDGSGKRDEDNPQPHGKVPSIEHDGVLVHEIPAIAAYLTDAFPRAKLGPAIGDPRRGPFLSWLAYYGGMLEPSATSKFLGWEVPRGTVAWVDLDEVLAHIDGTLQRQPYIVGEEFTMADVLYGGAFAFLGMNPKVPMTPAMKAYVERCVARPARARATARDDG